MGFTAFSRPVHSISKFFGCTTFHAFRSREEKKSNACNHARFPAAPLLSSSVELLAFLFKFPVNMAMRTHDTAFGMLSILRMPQKSHVSCRRLDSKPQAHSRFRQQNQPPAGTSAGVQVTQVDILAGSNANPYSKPSPRLSTGS